MQRPGCLYIIANYVCFPTWIMWSQRAGCLSCPVGRITLSAQHAWTIGVISGSGGKFGNLHWKRVRIVHHGDQPINCLSNFPPLPPKLLCMRATHIVVPFLVTRGGESVYNGWALQRAAAGWHLRTCESSTWATTGPRKWKTRIWLLLRSLLHPPPPPPSRQSVAVKYEKQWTHSPGNSTFSSSLLQGRDWIWHFPLSRIMLVYTWAWAPCVDFCHCWVFGQLDWPSFPCHTVLTTHMLSNEISKIPTTTWNQTYCPCVAGALTSLWRAALTVALKC